MQRLLRIVVTVGTLATLGAGSTLQAQCTLQLSESGTIHINSDEARTLSWNPVPGATSYLVEQLVEGLGDPAGPDFTFGGPYTESRNGEGKGITSVQVRHSVLYKLRIHYFVTALNRDNPAFQPCKADVLYVVEPDLERALIASKRIVPIAGKAHGMNGSDYTTALIIAGAGLGGSTDDPALKLYQGRVYFRPLGTTISADDPSVPYALDGDETVVFDDIMDTLHATGIGTLEVVPKVGYPTPMVDAIIDNKLPDGKKTGVRIPALWGRDQLEIRDAMTVGIRNDTDSRLSIGVRSLGFGGHVRIHHIAADGTELESAERFIGDDMTMLYPLSTLFTQPLHPGDRITTSYLGLNFSQPDLQAKGSILFLTETGNDLNNPNVVYRDSLSTPHYSRGFDRFLVY
jgi:hypothetical protein